MSLNICEQFFDVLKCQFRKIAVEYVILITFAANEAFKEVLAKPKIGSNLVGSKPFRVWKACKSAFNLLISLPLSAQISLLANGFADLICAPCRIFLFWGVSQSAAGCFLQRALWATEFHSATWLTPVSTPWCIKGALIYICTHMWCKIVSDANISSFAFAATPVNAVCATTTQCLWRAKIEEETAVVLLFAHSSRWCGNGTTAKMEILLVMLYTFVQRAFPPSSSTQKRTLLVTYCSDKKSCLH